MAYVIILVLLGLLIFQWRNGRNKQEEEVIKTLIVADEFKKTIALGLYQRFCKEAEDKKYSSIFLKTIPLILSILSQMY